MDFWQRQTGSRVCGVGELMAFLKVVVSFLCFFLKGFLPASG